MAFVSVYLGLGSNQGNRLQNLTQALDQLDFSQPMEIFSQTTKSPSEYAEICDRVRSLGHRVTVHDTICAQVANRHEHLAAFANFIK